MKHYHTTPSNVWIPFEFSVGPVMSRFYEGLKEAKIWSNQCPECQRVLVPARSFCPECRVDMQEWKEVPAEGEIVTWTQVNVPVFGLPIEPPFISALIRLDQTDCNLLHIVSGIDFNDAQTVAEKMKKGARVKAVWRNDKKGHMMDIQYFKPC